MDWDKRTGLVTLVTGIIAGIIVGYLYSDRSEWPHDLARVDKATLRQLMAENESKKPGRQFHAYMDSHPDKEMRIEFPEQKFDDALFQDWSDRILAGESLTLVWRPKAPELYTLAWMPKYNATTYVTSSSATTNSFISAGTTVAVCSQPSYWGVNNVTLSTGR